MFRFVQLSWTPVVWASAVVDTTATGAANARDVRAIVRSFLMVMVPRAQLAPLLASGPEAAHGVRLAGQSGYAQLVGSYLRTLHPSVADEDVLAFRVSRVRQVLAVPTIDYSDREPPIRTSVPGVYLVSSANIVDGTLNVDETLSLADRLLEAW